MLFSQIVLNSNKNTSNSFSFRLIVVVFLLSVLFSLTTFVSRADTKEDLAKQIQENKTKLDSLEKEINEYNIKIANTKGEAGTLKQALSILEARKKNLNLEIDSANLKIKNTEYDIYKVSDKIKDSNQKLEKLKHGMISSLKEIRYFQDEDNYMLTFLGKKTLSDISGEINNAESFKNSLQKSTTNAREIKGLLEKDKEVYEDKYNILKEQKEELSDKKKLVEQTRAENDRLLKETKSKEDIYKKKLAERKKIKEGLEKETLDFESKLKAIVNINLLPKTGNGILSYPIKKINITQYFGNTSFSTKNPQVYNGAGHNGIDFAVPIGTALYSAADGVVMGVDDSDTSCRGASYGKWVLIKHNNGLTTLYAHMSSFSVSEGQAVTSGQKIGLSGNTGYSTGPHLHFTVYATQGVHVAGPTEYKSKSCGTYMRIPIAPRNAYLNPLSYF